MRPTTFVHLHTHSHYSLLDGLSKIDALIARAKACQMPALALTDHGNLYGAIEFYKKAKKAGVRPIIGVEAYVATRTRFDKQPGVDDKRFNLTLLAQNHSGYKNLIKLVTKSHLEGYYYKPRVDKALLAELHEGIICLSGCMTGELSRTLRNKGMDAAGTVAAEYRDIFGPEHYFIEIMHHPAIEGAEKLRKELTALAQNLRIPLVATQDSHYPTPEERKAHSVLIAVQTNSDVGEAALFREEHEDFSFIDTETALRYFNNTPEAVANTGRIAERCDVELELGKWVFPDFHADKGMTYDEQLRALAYAGLAERGLARTKEVEEGLGYELGVIEEKKFSPYFLVVSDILRYAREQNILSTIRGSVSGSLVTYLVGITNVNPLDYKLPFERFLNPERPSAPDIDMDFADNRRDEVINYAREKYGEDKVAQIGTFGTMLARGAVRDVARALGYPYGTGDRIARLIPIGSQGFPMTIDRALALSAELQELYDKDAETREVVDLARKLEGCARHISVHAAGVVISPEPLSEFVPVQLDPKGGKVITQYDMHAVDDVGLLKFDFLGITNLAILGDSVRLVKSLRGIDVDIEQIPLDDGNTFALLSRGETAGLFQLNGAGMTRYLKDLEPSSIHDINAMVALYRPGPIDSIPTYIACKRHPERITYVDPRMEEILKDSYGVIAYQDDVLLIAIQLAGFSWLEADKLRKAMGKKIPEEMEAQRQKLLDGLVKKGMSLGNAQKLWKLIEPFAAYGFNKAHAASYGRVAYQTAYMKANYPIEYMTAILSAEAGDAEKIALTINECTRMGIRVLPPDVNESHGDFTIVMVEAKAPDTIRFGLHSIKNLGTEISDAIIGERSVRGAFTSLSEFLERIQHRNLNKKSLEALIKAGALDALGERGMLVANLEEALLFNRAASAQGRNQGSLFGLMADNSSVPQFRLRDAAPATSEEKLAWEKEFLGLYLSGHPLDNYRAILSRFKLSIAQAKELHEGTGIVVAGLVKEAKQVFTKNGEAMLFLRLADFSDTLEVVVFPRVFKEYASLFAINPRNSVYG